MFPKHTRLQKPFIFPNLTTKQSCFNHRLIKSRMVTECTCGQHTRHWRVGVLFRQCEASQILFKIIILACVVVHYICFVKGD